MCRSVAGAADGKDQREADERSRADHRCHRGQKLLLQHERLRYFPGEFNFRNPPKFKSEITSNSLRIVVVACENLNLVRKPVADLAKEENRAKDV